MKRAWRASVFWTLKTLSQILLKTLFRFRAVGREHVPTKGGLIIASNHLSYVDPVLVGAAVAKRPLRYMAKSELFRVPLLRDLISVLGAFPVERSVGYEGIKAAIDMIQRGDALVLFPEGTRSRTGKLGEAKPGVGWIIYETGATVIPASIAGSERIMPVGGKMMRFFAKVEVRFGKAVRLDDLLKMEKNRDTFTLISKRVMSAIAELQ